MNVLTWLYGTQLNLAPRYDHAASLATVNAMAAQIPPQTPIPAVQPATKEIHMSLATIVVDAEKGIEVGASDVLKFLTGAESELKLAPAALAGVSSVLGAVGTAVTASETASAAGFTSVTLDNAAIAAIKSVWPSIVAAFAGVGVKL